jgi:hypothetical protein
MHKKGMSITMNLIILIVTSIVILLALLVARKLMQPVISP